MGFFFKCDDVYTLSTGVKVLFKKPTSSELKKLALLLYVMIELKDDLTYIAQSTPTLKTELLKFVSVVDANGVKDKSEIVDGSLDLGMLIENVLMKNL